MRRLALNREANSLKRCYATVSDWDLRLADAMFQAILASPCQDVPARQARRSLGQAIESLRILARMQSTGEVLWLPDNNSSHQDQGWSLPSVLLIPSDFGSFKEQDSSI